MEKRIIYNNIEVIGIEEASDTVTYLAEANVMQDTPQAARLRLASEGIDVSRINQYLNLPDYGIPERRTFPLLSGAIAVYDGMKDIFRIHTLQVYFIVEKAGQESYRVTLTADGEPVQLLGGISEYKYLVGRIGTEQFFQVMGEMVALRDSQGRFER